MGVAEPDSDFEFLRLAELELEQGKVEGPEETCRRVLQQNPNHPLALLILGKIEALKGRLTESLELFQKLVQIDPANIAGWNWLVTLHREQRNLNQSISCGEEACRLYPDDADSHENLAFSQFLAGDLPNAALHYKRAAVLDPQNANRLVNLAATYEAQNLASKAEQTYLRAASTVPNNIFAMQRLAEYLLGINKREEAIIWLRKIINVDPSNLPVRSLLGQALTDAKYYEEAYEFLQETLKIDPSEEVAYGLLATVCQRFGRFEEANHYLDLLIHRRPDLPAPYYQRLNANKITVEDLPLVEQAVSLAKQVASPGDLRLLHSGLGKAFNDLKQYEKAMWHYDESNRAARAIYRNSGFSRHKHSAEADRIIGTFSEDFIKQNAIRSNESDLPIIVCGMPRSGTTLTTQILSNHPAIGGAGELQFWTSRIKDAWASSTRLDGDQVRYLAEEYLELLRSTCPRKKHVVDKMPQNFYTAGLINIAFPNAKIIHCRRNPVDNCLSIYFAAFQDPMDYCHVRENIVFAYRCYLRVVDHWRKTLPKDRFLEIDYEELTTNPEPVTARMLDFIGLEWDDACLRPQENTQVVTTASLWQARQPIYQTSVERWRNYEPWLGAFAELLDTRHGLPRAA